MTRPGIVLLCAGLLLLGTRGGAAPGVNLFPPPGGEGTGERELTALAHAYPDLISQVTPRDGDWAVQVDGEWFYWSHGRILPQSQRADWEQYARFRFYRYPLGGLPPIPHLDAETAARLKKRLEEARLNPPHRSERFLQRLFGAGSQRETERRMVTVDFLGFPVKVHQRIAEALQSVASECDTLRRTNAEAAAFFHGLSKIDGFNYREVAGTFTRSYHGYGLAVDLIPRSYGGRDPYWRWAMEKTDQWWETPYQRRWMVPPSIIAAFERHGFVWGGKWLFFDTMHFEFRPEIFILAREKEAS
jgi:hypothetical protein